MSRHHRRKDGQQPNMSAHPAQSPDRPPYDENSASESPSPGLEGLPIRMAAPGMAVVPSEVMAQVQRQWFWFVILAGLCLLLAVSSIAGWGLYMQAGRGLKSANKSLDDANGRAAGANQIAENRITAAERARKDAEDRLYSTERTRADFESRLKSTEQARSEIETKLKSVDQAREEAVANLADARRSWAALSEDLHRLQGDVQMYRQEARSAGESEHRAMQKLQEVLVGMIAADLANPGPISPTASPNTDQPSIAEANTSLASKPAEPVVLAATTQPSSPEGNIVAVHAGHNHSAQPTTTAESPEPAVEAANPEELLPWGEAMIVADYPDRAVALIRKAIEKGGQSAEYHKSLGWAFLQAGRPAEAKAALEAALVGFEDWPATSADATPDHWTAAFLLGRVSEEEYVRRWARDPSFETRLACLPWFYIGQRREIDGHPDEAMTAYKVSVEMGRTPGSYPIWRWAQQRLHEMEKAATASQPAQ